MAKPSFSVPDELLEKFDDTIWQLKTEGKIDRDASRSQVIRALMADWVEQHGGEKSYDESILEPEDDPFGNVLAEVVMFGEDD